MRRDIHTYPPADRPDVEVRVDGEWLPGEARQRWLEDDGWHYNVQWRPKGTHTRRLDNFASVDVRADETVWGPKGE